MKFFLVFLCFILIAKANELEKTEVKSNDSIRTIKLLNLIEKGVKKDFYINLYLQENISEDDALHTYEYDDYFKILPAINEKFLLDESFKNGKQVKSGFSYTSNNNSEWMSSETLNEWIISNSNKKT